MIKIICVGKIKEKFFKEALLEYEKRLNKYTKLAIIEVEDEENSNKNIVLQKEKEKILKHIDDKDFVITTEIEGESFSSLAFASNLDKILSNNKNVTFIIGGSYGLAEEIKQRSNLALSFSKFTFPHQLFRIILLEQIYRAYKIINGETYHK